MSFCLKCKWYVMIELMFLKEIILTKQVHEKSAIFFTIGIFLNKQLKFQTYLCNRCYALLMMLMSLIHLTL